MRENIDPVFDGGMLSPETGWPAGWLVNQFDVADEL
jgi:hypothetical protein